MTKNKIINAVKNTAKIAVAAVTLGTIAEAGYHGARMLESDIECTVKYVDSKVNPTIMKKPGLFKKPQKYNTRTKKFVDAKKKPAKKVVKTKKTSKKSK